MSGNVCGTANSTPNIPILQAIMGQPVISTNTNQVNSSSTDDASKLVKVIDSRCDSESNGLRSVQSVCL